MSGQVKDLARTSKSTESTISSIKVLVCKRNFIASGEMKWIAITGGSEKDNKERPLNSKVETLQSGICPVDENGVARLLLWNIATEPLVLKAGREVGKR